MSQTLENPVAPAAAAQPRTVYRSPWYQRKRTRQIVHTIVVYALVLPGAIIFIIPLFWMLSTALKPSNQIFVYPPRWVPDPVMWSNFSSGWNDYLNFNQMMINSLTISLHNVVANVISCSLAAYGIFARLRAPGKNFFALVLATMLLPTEVTIIPQYVLFTWLGWNDTWRPLMVPAWFAWPFFIFLLRQFFMSIPHDLDEAARLDGALLLAYFVEHHSAAGEAGVGYGGHLLLHRQLEQLPCIADLHSEHRQAGAGGRSGHCFMADTGRSELNYMMAVALMVLMPVLMVFFFGQRLFVRGIALTGIKG